MYENRIEAAAQAVCESRHRHHKTKRDYWTDAGDYAQGQYRDDARAALAAADKAATITTVEELDALPEGSVVLGWAYNGSTPYLRCLSAHGRLVWGCVGQRDLFKSADMLADGFKARVIHFGGSDV